MESQIKEYMPCESLRPFVELFWEGSFNINATGSMSMQMIPNGCLELIIHLNDLHCDLENNKTWSQTPDYLILGLITQPCEVRFKNCVSVFAIRFKPEGIYNIFGVPSSLLMESYEDMSMVLGHGFLDFSKRLKEKIGVDSMIRHTENYLLKNLLDKKIDLNYVNLAAELIRNTKGVRIKDLSSQLYISQRQLEREFKEKLGISPKHYLRIVRINEVLRLLNEDHMIDLTSVAYQCGYFDQAHFIKDFKKITGQKPTIFMMDKEQFISNPGLAHYVD
ncbi:AraC family transcriptional regulator [Arenibacter sp. BSSL-BM3]|uniref:AraC family transcriptional regulator n=1 Tax=Arenibacter arenosicollis TaxID=2762274 RepID=A0ABR7QTD9_9FLAO|nr:helix-turn-helix transcriptional regulator [Arenibacter arenosicollis]MBC8770423.1 AraC family transcriptional regulator [Arenibacter arenosicollis]